MKVETLLENLKKELAELTSTIKVLESRAQSGSNHKAKTLKGRTVKNHWMKRPENKAKVMKLINKMHKARAEAKVNNE